MAVYNSTTLDAATSAALERRMRGVLAGYGLSELAGWATRLLSGGASFERFEIELEDQPAFQSRFRAMFDRRAQIANGRDMVPISVAEILQYEKQVAELESFYGYPRGTLGDPQDRLVDDVSYNELQSLVAAEESFLASDETTQRIFQQFYRIGATKGELVSAAINADMGVPLLQQRIQAANVASESVTSGFGALTAAESEDLVSRGVDEPAAREAFSLLARSTQLTNNFTRSDLLALAAGEAPALEKYTRSRDTALSQFAGGGSFAGGTGGLA